MTVSRYITKAPILAIIIPNECINVFVSSFCRPTYMTQTYKTNPRMCSKRGVCRRVGDQEEPAVSASQALPPQTTTTQSYTTRRTHGLLCWQAPVFPQLLRQLPPSVQVPQAAARSTRTAGCSVAAPHPVPVLGVLPSQGRCRRRKAGPRPYLLQLEGLSRPHRNISLFQSEYCRVIYYSYEEGVKGVFYFLICFVI